MLSIGGCAFDANISMYVLQENNRKYTYLIISVDGKHNLIINCLKGACAGRSFPKGENHAEKMGDLPEGVYIQSLRACIDKDCHGQNLG